MLKAIPVSTQLLSGATSLANTLVQLPRFLLDDGILILIQTVLFSFERWLSSVHDTPHCPSCSVPVLYITARPVLQALPAHPSPRVLVLALCAPGGEVSMSPARWKVVQDLSRWHRYMEANNTCYRVLK